MSDRALVRVGPRREGPRGLAPARRRPGPGASARRSAPTPGEFGGFYESRNDVHFPFTTSGLVPAPRAAREGAGAGRAARGSRMRMRRADRRLCRSIEMRPKLSARAALAGLALAVPLALGFVAPAAAGSVEDDWHDFAFHRCAEPVMRNAQIVTGDLTALPALDANRIDIRSNGIAWTNGSGKPILVHMEHVAGAETYVGCRVAFPITTSTTVPMDVSTAIARFEDWIENNIDNRTFRDVACSFGDNRIYARKIKTRSETRPGVNVSIVIEAGSGGSFLFFAAVEEPVGVGECINSSG